MQEVQSLFDSASAVKDFKIFIHARQIRQLDGLNHLKISDYHHGIAQYWTGSRTGADLCFTPDMVHHISGLPRSLLVLGHAHTGGTCNLFPKSQTKGASHSNFSNKAAIKSQAFVIAHELMHQVGLGHESCESMPAGKHCFMPSSAYTFGEQHNYSDIWMSQNYKNILTTILNQPDRACLRVDNQQPDVDLDPECQSCDGVVILTAQNAEYLNYLDFSCQDTIHPDSFSFPLLTLFKNSCDVREVKVEVFYNDNHLDSLILPDGFSQPESFITNDYSKKVTSNNFLLCKGAAHASVYRAFFNGNSNYNIVAGQNGTAIRIRYVDVSDPPFSFGPTDATYRFLFPYVIDMRGHSFVNASEIQTPVQDQLYNFCSGIRHDIYIDGELYFDYPATFCNAHFIMGENAKITIPQGMPVTFENCTFRTCDPDMKWHGIEMANSAVINIKGNSKFYNARTAIKGLDNADINVNGDNINKRVEFHHCTVGIEAKNGGTLDVSHSLFEKPFIAIDVFNQAANVESTIFNAASGGYGIRIVQSPDRTAFLSVSKDCIFNKHLRGIYAKNTMVRISKTIFDENNNAILITDTPKMLHEINNNTIFRNSKADALIVSNSTSINNNLPSIVEGCQFIGGRQIAIRLSNTKIGWKIDNSSFTNNRTGIRMSNAHDNRILGSIFNFSLSDRAYASNMNFIHISSSNNNEIGSNQPIRNHFSISTTVQPSDVYRHIFLNNGGFNNRVYCNDFLGGNRGINPWGPSMTDIAGNLFTTIDRGFYYGLQSGDQVTTTGTQDFKNNKWTLADPDNDVGATHLGANVDLVRQSQYRVHSDDKQYLPVFEAVAEDWFFEPSNPQTPYNCSTGFTGGGGNGIFQMMTLGNGFNGFQFIAGMTAAAQDFIYDAIVSGETFGESSGDVSSYMDTLESNQDLYHVKEAEKLIYARASNQQGIEVRYEALQSALDEYYTLDGISEATRDSFLLVIAQLSATAETIYSVYRSELDTNLVLAQNHLSQVSSAQPYWYNKAKTLSVLAQKWQGIEPDSVTMDMLEYIAHLCPLEGGKGVYIARGILSEYILEEVIYDDLAKCDSLIPRTSNHKGTIVQVYPNPTSNDFIVESNHQIKKIVVTDMTGKTIYNLSLDDVKARISTNGWQPGMYIISVSFKDDHNAETKKLIVIP